MESMTYILLWLVGGAIDSLLRLLSTDWRICSDAWHWQRGHWREGELRIESGPYWLWWISMIVVRYRWYLLDRYWNLLFLIDAAILMPPVMGVYMFSPSISLRAASHDPSFKRLLLRSDIQRVLQTLNGMLRVKAGRGWINWLLKTNLAIRGGNTSSVARLAVYYIRVLYAVYRNEGLRGLVIKTKAWYVLTMQAVGGMRIPATQPLGCAVGRASNGLPRIIPRESRLRITQGDKYHLRLWLSWFSIYRVLVLPGKLKLGTITKPGANLNPLWKEALQVIAEFCGSLGFKSIGSASKRLDTVRYVPLSKSTPSIVRSGAKISGSPEGILSGGIALLCNPVYGSWRFLAERIDPSGVRPKGSKTIWECLDELAAAKPMKSHPEGHSQWPIGKLGYKLEAAGKVRVFAMVECWTQWLLRPVHLFLFKILEGLPSDGTMDQLSPVNRLLEMGKTRFWCYDLSAATDRLPVDLQANILNYLFGESFGWAWKNLLVGRDYYLPSKAPKGVLGSEGLPQSVRYAVGQPMGALSSWAMLALTHHLIVAWAARRVGYPVGTFWDYAVLGDDIVIANGKVAGAYLQLMESLGVEIGLAKSLVSRKGVLEFAKRYFVQGKDCAPIPFKEQVAALVNFESSTEFIRKYELGSASIAAFVGWGYRVRGRLSATFDKLPRRLATIGKWRASPWGTLGHNVRSWLNINSFVIRSEWLVQTTETWPDLPEAPSKSFIDWASKDEQKVKRLKDDLPTRGIYSGSKWASRWMEDGLYKIADSVGTEYLHYPAKFYNVLFWIQSDQWSVSIPALKSDLSEVSSMLFSMRTARVPLDESKFLRWIDSFKLRGQLAKPRILGTKTELRAKPSILLATRLHDWARSRDHV